MRAGILWCLPVVCSVCLRAPDAGAARAALRRVGHADMLWREWQADGSGGWTRQAGPTLKRAIEAGRKHVKKSRKASAKAKRGAVHGMPKGKPKGKAAGKPKEKPGAKNGGRMDAALAAICLRQWRSRLEEQFLPPLLDCLEQLSEDEIWWRPNEASNSAGNLVLHLCGNMRQWIISGLGGAKDIRERDKEFSERGPMARGALGERFRQTVKESLRGTGAAEAGRFDAEVSHPGVRRDGL